MSAAGNGRPAHVLRWPHLDAADLDAQPGLLPPHSIESERRVLAAGFVDADFLRETEAQLQPEHFFRPTHQHLWAAMLAVLDGGTAVTDLSVSHVLRHRGELDAAGGLPGIRALIAALPSLAGVRDEVAVIRDLARRRALLAAGTAIRALATEDGAPLDSWSRINAAHDLLLQLVANEPGGVTDPAAVMDAGLWDELLEWAANPSVPSGIPTGLPSLDAVLSGGGLVPGKLYLVGGDTSTGKSSFLRYVLLQIAERGDPVILFSVEQTAAEVTEELAWVLSRIDKDQHEREHQPLTEAEEARLMDARVRIENLRDRFLIDDRKTPTARSIRRELVRQRMRHPTLRVCAVDYLGLVTAAPGEGIEETARSLLLETGALGITCLLAHQFTKAARDTTRNPDLRPRIEHFRESATITQGAYAILGLFRRDYYVRQGLLAPDLPNPDVPGNYDRDGQPAYRETNELEILVLKQQRGEAGVSVTIQFHPATRQFVDRGPRREPRSTP